MTHASHTAGARVLAVAVVALLLGACSGTSTNDTAANPAAASSPNATSPSSATSVAVTEKEFSITLSQATFSPAAYAFTIQNQGSFPHNLVIEGPGVDKKTSPTLAGGASGSLTADLQKGSYELWCSVPGHKEKGMDMTITVG